MRRIASGRPSPPALLLAYAAPSAMRTRHTGPSTTSSASSPATACCTARSRAVCVVITISAAPFASSPASFWITEARLHAEVAEQPADDCHHSRPVLRPQTQIVLRFEVGHRQQRRIRPRLRVRRRTRPRRDAPRYRQHVAQHCRRRRMRPGARPLEHRPVHEVALDLHRIVDPIDLRERVALRNERRMHPRTDGPARDPCSSRAASRRSRARARTGSPPA